MMAKYQVVFIKLEAAVQKLTSFQNARQQLLLQRAFSRFRRNARLAAAETGKAQLAAAVFRKVRSKVSILVKICAQKRKMHLAKTLHQLKNFATFSIDSQKLERKLKDLAEKQKRESATKEQTICELEAQTNKKTSEIESLRTTEAELTETLKAKEETEVALKDTLEKFKKTKPGSAKPKNSEEKIKELEGKIRALENENKMLREEWDATETNVESFVKEISDMIDSQEFTRFYLLFCRGISRKTKFRAAIRR